MNLLLEKDFVTSLAERKTPILRHYTDFLLTEVEDVEQRSEFTYKPEGLWVSDESEYGWNSWTKDAGFTRGQFVYKIELQGNILLIQDLLDFERFTQKYGTVYAGNITGYFRHINWKEVADSYDGIFITPYNPIARQSYSWYYPWDCASGCIWKAKAVKTLRRVR